jgi:hypothetical protein
MDDAPQPAGDGTNEALLEVPPDQLVEQRPALDEGLKEETTRNLRHNPPV